MKRVITLVAVVLGGLALVVGAASAAGAHGGPGVLEVEAAHPTSTGVHYIVALTYENDGDAATGATVTATPISPSGEEGAAATLAPAEEGTYEGPVDMPDPGQWTVRFESTEPPATLERTATISETTTTTTPTTGADGESEGFAPADDGTGDSAAGDDDSGSDSMPILLIVVAAAVAIGGVVTALRIVARNRPGAERS
jgi:YtkA-like